MNGHRPARCPRPLRPPWVPPANEPRPVGTGLVHRVTAGTYIPPSLIPWTAGIVPRRPFWKSSKACWSSSRVFMTNGP